MNRNIDYKITKDMEGMTIGQFLKYKGYSHPIVVHLKKTDKGIMLNGEWAYVNQKLKEHDTLSIHLIENLPSQNIPPTKIDLLEFKEMIVFEDDDILVINKPANLPVHPSMGHHEDTLANYCAYYFKQTHHDGAFVFRCVNRLDKDTSGLVLIAKNMLSSAILSMSQHSHAIKRTYLAITEGITTPAGTIDAPIARVDNSVIEREVNYETGEKAITHYELIDTVCMEDASYSLVKIHLETGRTHQIRVHMKSIGHPLPGDFLYNPDFSHINRQALHSYALEFTHPISGEQLLFKQLPPDDFFFASWNTACLI